MGYLKLFFISLIGLTLFFIAGHFFQDELFRSLKDAENISEQMFSSFSRQDVSNTTIPTFELDCLSHNIKQVNCGRSFMIKVGNNDFEILQSRLRMFVLYHGEKYATRYLSIYECNTPELKQLYIFNNLVFLNFKRLIKSHYRMFINHSINSDSIYYSRDYNISYDIIHAKKSER